jgi:copper chaperone CopZ
MYLVRCTQVVLKVEMPCSGCSGAVERVLKKMEGGHCSCIKQAFKRTWAHPYCCIGAAAGVQVISLPCMLLSHDVQLLPAGFPAGVESFDVSLEQQRVVVRGNVTPQAVLETVAKTGKKAELVQ